MIKKLSLVLVASALLSGCLNTTVTNDDFISYTIVDGINPNALHSDMNVTVKVKAPLNKGNIVVKTSDVGLRVTNSHKWAQSLDEQLKFLTISELYNYALPSHLEYDLQILQFYGSVDGNVYIALSCKVKQGELIRLDKAYESVEMQKSDGYEALVEALKEGYIKLVKRIALDLMQRQHKGDQLNLPFSYLFTDAEGREDFTQEIIGGDGTGNGTQMILRLTDFLSAEH